MRMNGYFSSIYSIVRQLSRLAPRLSFDFFVENDLTTRASDAGAVEELYG
jgi:hypothetical protein